MTADEYAKNVSYALHDLPWRHRRDLVAELREHLAELPPDTDFAARLGSPEKYAADLRAAAGLERQHGAIAFLRARRPLYLILTVLVVMLGGLAIATVVWVNSYQPIVYGSATQLPLDSKPSSGQNGVTVVFRPGRPFLYGITIRNNRRFAVRILGVPKQVTDYYRGHLFTSKPSVNDNEHPLVHFRPFDLQPGQERWLVFKGVYACTAGTMAYGGTITWPVIPVRYSFLWRTATTDVPLENPLTFIFKGYRCQ